MVFSLPGLLFLASLVYALRRPQTNLNRGLLLITGTTTAYYLLGTFLGGFYSPVNLIKANEFAIILAGPFIGLSLAGLLRWSRLKPKMQYAVPVLALLLVAVFLHNFNVHAKSKIVRTARTTAVPTWNLDPGEMSKRKSSVFLTANEALYAFYPVYAFIANNEHYSHPASNFKDRYDFLNLLQENKEPYIFNLALRHNIFDPVDYFMPRDNKGRFVIPVSLSNYPNKFTSKQLTFDKSLVADTTLFIKRP